MASNTSRRPEARPRQAHRAGIHAGDTVAPVCSGDARPIRIAPAPAARIRAERALAEPRAGGSAAAALLRRDERRGRGGSYFARIPPIGFSAARLVRLEKGRLDRYLSTHPQVAENLRNVFLPMFYRNEIVRVLRILFGDLSEDMLADIVDLAARRAR